MAKMTDREKDILEILKNNPMISQEELADALNITRSAAAVHISNLIKKGHILGRGYVFNDKTGVLVAGSIYVHISAVESAGTSEIAIAPGGTGYRIALNLSNAGTQSSLVSAVGRDEWGETIVRNLREAGVDTRYIVTAKDRPTSKKISIGNSPNTRKVIADRQVLDHLNLEAFQNFEVVVAGSRMVVLDSLMPSETLRFLNKAAKAASVFSCIVFNEETAEISCDCFKDMNLAVMAGKIAEKITGTKIRDLDDGINAAKEMVKSGIETVVVAVPQQGVSMACGNDGISVPLPPGQTKNTNICVGRLTSNILTNVIRGFEYRQNLRLALANLE